MSRREICQMIGDYDNDAEQMAADAEFIVCAVNAHNTLVNACTLAAASNMIGTDEPSVTISRAAYDAIIEALAKVQP